MHRRGYISWFVVCSMRAMAESADSCSHRLGAMIPLVRGAGHYKCRNSSYPFSQVRRFPVGDEHVDWLTPYSNYQPVYYESANIKNKPWADPKLDEPTFHPKWHQIDNGIDRRSHEVNYQLIQGAPQNPAGRTGIIGRGVLGKWGPNHAADPVVTRWKRDDQSPQQPSPKILHAVSNLPILQFCAIQRHDNHEWAIPGGMVDPNEKISQTLMREFMEEAMNSLDHNAEQSEANKRMVEEFFKDGVQFYAGYVDDPRNTDNAWMETVAVNFHDETGEFVGKLPLVAGDDAKAVRWMDIDSSLALYASHERFIQHVAKIRGAHF